MGKHGEIKWESSSPDKLKHIVETLDGLHPPGQADISRNIDDNLADRLSLRMNEDQGKYSNVNDFGIPMLTLRTVKFQDKITWF